jgi:hypothetical protein
MEPSLGGGAEQVIPHRAGGLRRGSITAQRPWEKWAFSALHFEADHVVIEPTYEVAGTDSNGVVRVPYDRVAKIEFDPVFARRSDHIFVEPKSGRESGG